MAITGTLKDALDAEGRYVPSDEEIEAYWKFTPDELTGQPHLEERLIDVCTAAAELVSNFAPAAPLRVSIEALLRVAYWLYETRSQTTSDENWYSGPLPRNILGLVGARSLLAPYRRIGAVVVRRQ